MFSNKFDDNMCFCVLCACGFLAIVTIVVYIQMSMLKISSSSLLSSTVDVMAVPSKVSSTNQSLLRTPC